MSQKIVINNSFNNHPKGDKPSTKARWIFILSVILGSPVIAACISWWGGRHPNITSAAAESPKEEITFVGKVIKRDGEAISNATVLAIADQTPGQTLLTDANGQFHIQLSIGTHSLSLTIKAPGYKIQNIDANVHRTGPEVVVLTPQSFTSSAIPSHRSASPAGHGSSEKLVQDCKDSICIGGSNSGPLTQIHLEKPTPPDRQITQENGEKAVAILKTLDPGHPINIVFGGTPEADAFAKQLGAIFVDAKWQPVRTPVSKIILGYETADGFRQYDGKDLVCYRQPDASDAATAVVKALSAAGYPCREIQSSWAPEIKIFVGTKYPPN